MLRYIVRRCAALGGLTLVFALLAYSGRALAADNSQALSIIYERRIENVTTVMAFDVARLVHVPLTRESGIVYAAVPSPNGTQLALVMRYEGELRLFLLNLFGEGAPYLVGNDALSANISPTWSPDSRYVAYGVLKDEGGQIAVLNVEAADSRTSALPITRAPFNQTTNFRLPVWSPNSEWLAFLGWGTGDNELYRARRDRTVFENLTQTPGVWETTPSFSPDGTQIAYYADPEGQYQLFVMNADGSNPHAITDEEEVYFSRESNHIAWSPDGTQLAFTSLRDRDGEIEVVQLDNGERLRLTDNVATESDALWTPDGRDIIYLSDASGRTHLYRISASGSTPQALTWGDWEVNTFYLW